MIVRSNFGVTTAVDFSNSCPGLVHSLFQTRNEEAQLDTKVLLQEPALISMRLKHPGSLLIDLLQRVVVVVLHVSLSCASAVSSQY